MTLEQGTVLTCDSCLSSHIIETDQGYVCVECGLMAESPLFEFSVPFHKTKNDHEIVSYTSIGTAFEQKTNKRAKTMHRLHIQQTHSHNDYEEIIKQQIRTEVSRILFVLGFSSTHKEEIIRKTIKARDGFDKGAKLRNPQKITPLVLYYVFKSHSIPLNSKDLIEISYLSKVEFDHYRLKVLEHLHIFRTTNRRNYILNLLTRFQNTFHLDPKFISYANVLLTKLCPILTNYRDTTIASVISIILCQTFYSDKSLPITQITSHYHIAYTTIQNRIQDSICNSLGIKGFTTLGASRDIFKSILEKVSIITSKPTKRRVEKDELRKIKPQKERERIGEVKSFILTSKSLLKRRVFIVQEATGLPLILIYYTNQEILTIETFTFFGKGPPD